MSEQNQAFSWLGATIAAALSGLAGTVVGVKVQGSEIANIKDRQNRFDEQLDRIEDKLDRLIERL